MENDPYTPAPATKIDMPVVHRNALAAVQDAGLALVKLIYDELDGASQDAATALHAAAMHMELFVKDIEEHFTVPATPDDE